MTKSFHVIEYLDHDVVARCVTIRIALGDMVPNLVVQFLSGISTAIAASLVEIVVELKCQNSATIGKVMKTHNGTVSID